MLSFDFNGDFSVVKIPDIIRKENNGLDFLLCLTQCSFYCLLLQAEVLVCASNLNAWIGFYKDLDKLVLVLWLKLHKRGFQFEVVPFYCVDSLFSEAEVLRESCLYKKRNKEKHCLTIINFVQGFYKSFDL